MSNHVHVDCGQCRRLMPIFAYNDTGHCRHWLLSIMTLANVDACRCRFKSMSNLANVDSGRCRFKLVIDCHWTEWQPTASAILPSGSLRVSWDRAGIAQRLVAEIWIFLRSVAYSPPVHRSLRQRSYHVENTASRPISEVKQRWVWLVLGWVTAWEYQMLLAFCYHSQRFLSLFFCPLISIIDSYPLVH